MGIDLDGKCVIHKTFGKGFVTDFDGSYLDVDFKGAGKKCKFQFPSCFYGYLKLEDDEIQRVIEPVVERWKEENEIDRWWDELPGTDRQTSWNIRKASWNTKKDIKSIKKDNRTLVRRLKT